MVHSSPKWASRVLSDVIAAGFKTFEILSLSAKKVRLVAKKETILVFDGASDTSIMDTLGV